MARLRPRILVWAGVVFTIVWMPANGPAKPRAPLPPLPELAPLLYRASFDEPAASVDAKAERSPASGDFVESWSGYALSRTARSAAPFVIPGLDAGGRANLAPAEGSIRFWFRPAWTSAGRAKGGGPGDTATLLEMIALGQKDALVLWTLAVSPDGSTLSLAGATGAGAEVLLRAPFDWQAGEAHLVTLNYGSKGTALLLNGMLVAEGNPVLSVPSEVAALAVGSTAAGHSSAGGDLDEVCTFAGPLPELAVAFYYGLTAPRAALGPITPEEEEAARQRAAPRRAQSPAGGGGGSQLLRLLGGTSTCVTNVPVFITNLTAVPDTNGITTTTFDIQGSYDGGTTALYDIFTTTNLIGLNSTNVSIADSLWTWLERGPTCSTYQYTNSKSLSS